MLATMKRVKIQAQRWYDKRSLTTQTNLADMGWMALTAAVLWVMCFGLTILLILTTTWTGLAEPLNPGEYEAIRQIHAQGQSVTTYGHQNGVA